MRTGTLSMGGAAALAIWLAFACGDPVAGDPVDVRGDWVLYDVLSATGIVCRDTLNIFFIQKEHDLQGTFNLRGVCIVGAADTTFTTGSGVLGNGVATTEAITFHASNCFYEGTLFHQPADSAAGKVNCDARIDDEPVQLSGTWSAHRH